MENETRRGYEVPLTGDKRAYWFLLAMELAGVCLVEWMASDGSNIGVQSLAYRGIYLLLIPGACLILATVFGKLRLQPEGISVIVFGKTVRFIRREDIRLIAGFGCNYGSPSSATVRLCISGYTLYQLAEAQERRTPEMFRDPWSRPGWMEEQAARYLMHDLRFLKGLYGAGEPPILFLEWSAETQVRLRQMYPLADWADLTVEKILDAQRNI